MSDLVNKVEFAYSSNEEAFPTCDPGVLPFGSRVLVQIRSSKSVTKGGIILLAETKDTEVWNTQVAKVVALGPLAFHNRTTLTPWPEGGWCDVGDFVRVARYGGDRWTAKNADGEGESLFVLFNDLDLIGKVTGDPLTMKAFV